MKINNILYIALATTMLVGCRDFFNNESPSAIDSKTVFSDAMLTEQAICGIYQELGQDKGYTNRLACGFVGLNTDIEWSTWSTKTDDQGRCVNYDMQSANGSLSSNNGDSWLYLGTMAERCNNAIEGIRQYGDTTEGSLLRYYLGEVLFLRSFVYLEMVKYWGDVPARFESLAKDPSSVDAAKTDRNVIYAQIRQDLREAARLMPWSGDAAVPVPCRNKTGRASRGAALALLARADLMYAGKAVRPLTLEDPQNYSVRYNIEDNGLRQELFEEVMWACAEVIKAEDYKLAADFERPFRQLCEDCLDYSQMEHIWVIPFANGSRGQVLGYGAPKLGSTEINSCVGHLPGLDKGAKSNAHQCVSPYLVYQFDAQDRRRNVTFVTGTWTYDDGTKNYKKDREYIFPGVTDGENRLYQKVVNINNFYLAKYRFEWMKRLVSGDDGVDFPILRYADVLLMFAEASIGSNTGVVPANKTGLDAVEQFNKIRRRAGISEVHDLTFDLIQLERAKELCGEFVRKWDLMRWGILKQQVLEAEYFVRDISVNVGGVSAELAGREVEISDTIWYKLTAREDINGGFVIDSIYGLAPGETSRPAWFSREGGWTTKTIFGSSSKWVLSAGQYPLYFHEEDLERRQYWPIWLNYIGASNGKLWNNYGY